MSTATISPMNGLNLTTTQFNLATHNGMITIFHPATGNHRTFRIETREFSDGEVKRVVSLLIGPDRDDRDAWRPFGFAIAMRHIAVWRKCQGTPGQPSDFQKFARMLEWPEKYEARGLVYQIEGRCRKCNKPLTHPSSLTSGLGPVCAGKA